MPNYREFSDAAPDIAGLIAERISRAGIMLCATIRRDGSPRNSPIEVSFVDGGLYVGMMPGSAKLADVRRDSRVCMLTPVADRHDVGGEGKIFGRLVGLEPAEADRVLRAFSSDPSFDPDALAGSPMFEVLVDAAAWQVVDGDSWTTSSWSPDSGARRRRRDGATGAAQDV